MKRLVHVDVLSVVFGLGTWLCVNGLWVELPLLVQKLPESWDLPSYLSVVIQLANIGPLSYTLLNNYFPKHVTEVRAIYCVMSLGLVSTILLSIFWEKTTFVAGTNHSTALLVLVFFLAAVDCSSRVTYLPFMARFEAVYLTSYFIGEGLSGFFPSLIALAQGVGGNAECRNNSFGNGTESFTPDPRFSVDIFFYMLFIFTLFSAIAFYCMTLERVVKGAYAQKSTSRVETGVQVTSKSKRKNDRDNASTSSTASSCEFSVFEPPSMDNTCDNNENVGDDRTNCAGRPRSPQLGLLDSGNSDETTSLIGMSEGLFMYLLTVQVVVCMLSNGVFPSIQSYSCLPYGNEAYHLAITLSNMANPTVCFLAFFVPSPTKFSITFATILSFILSGYVMATAVMSPSPPLVGQSSGEILLIASWIVLVALFTYVRVSVAIILRNKGQSGLLWCGAVSQCGSTIGAIAAFVVLNYTNVFKQYYPCS